MAKTKGNIVAILLVAMLAGHLEARHHQKQGIDVIAINTAGFDPARYSRVAFRLITDDKFLYSMGKSHNEGAIAKRADWWDAALAGYLRDALRPGDQGWSGTKPLQLTVGMLDMTNGKRGIVRWQFYLWDGQIRVADFTVTAPNGSGFLTDSTGQRHRKELLPKIVDAINEFLGRLGPGAKGQVPVL